MNISFRSFSRVRIRRHHIVGRAASSTLLSGLKLQESGGRSCPVHYRYSPRDLFEKSNDLDIGENRALYVVGGLYGNIDALKAIEMRADLEIETPAIVFNGDFHFFNADPAYWHEVNQVVMRHHAITGNVEREISGPSDGSCGCAYPSYVSEDIVERSNDIVGRLREVAQQGDRSVVDWLAQLPMFMTIRVGPLRVGVVHGDLHALAGWSLSVEALEPLDLELHSALGCDRDPYFESSSVEDVEKWLAECGCDAITCTHTCLPVAQTFTGCAGHNHGTDAALFNNGAAGMPNFQASRFGVMTRVAVSTEPPKDSLYGVQLGRVRMDAIPIHYDHAAWVERFTSIWPAGSSAHVSYFKRITEGPDYRLGQAARCDLTSDADVVK